MPSLTDYTMKTYHPVRRHIQDFGTAKSLEKHWGYVDRVVPCTNDPGSCAYLDSVYHNHDISMIYSFILWAAIGGVLLLWGLGRYLGSSRTSTAASGGVSKQGRRNLQTVCFRITRSITSLKRRFLDTESLCWVFGRTTRLQVLIAAMLMAYLAVFNFIGIVYKEWVTPVKGMPGVFNTRSGLGPWSDRIGVFAFALTPLSVLLSSRESVLSLITGLPYQSFMFLHRWLGYIIFLQSALHTIGWTIVEAKLYQPQPSVWNEFIAESYIVWGVVAMIFVTFLFVFSTRWAVQITGHEFFRKAHYTVAMLFVGACWVHWSHLSCWMIASLGVWLLDRCIRLLRTVSIHYRCNDGDRSGLAFKPLVATMHVLQDDINGDVVRSEFQTSHAQWNIGQHFFLCFPEISIWQGHPFTPSTRPLQSDKKQSHLYIIRAKAGATRKLARLAHRKQGAEHGEKTAVTTATTTVVLSGPYGQPIIERKGIPNDVNVLCIAGGTGITYVLPVVMDVLAQAQTSTPSRVLELIWMIRLEDDMHWISEELSRLRSSTSPYFMIRNFITRENTVGSRAGTNDQHLLERRKEIGVTIDDIDRPNFEPNADSSAVATVSPASTENSNSPLNNFQHFVITQLGPQNVKTCPSTKSRAHPNLSVLVDEFVASRVVHGPTQVFASGPPGMISDLRSAVASYNSPGKVWKGNEKYDVMLTSDDRLEW